MFAHTNHFKMKPQDFKDERVRDQQPKLGLSDGLIITSTVLLVITALVGLVILICQ